MFDFLVACPSTSSCSLVVERAGFLSVYLFEFNYFLQFSLYTPFSLLDQSDYNVHENQTF